MYCMKVSFFIKWPYLLEVNKGQKNIGIHKCPLLCVPNTQKPIFACPSPNTTHTQWQTMLIPTPTPHIHKFPLLCVPNTQKPTFACPSPNPCSPRSKSLSLNNEVNNCPSVTFVPLQIIMRTLFRLIICTFWDGILKKKSSLDALSSSTLIVIA